MAKSRIGKPPRVVVLRKTIRNQVKAGKREKKLPASRFGMTLEDFTYKEFTRRSGGKRVKWLTPTKGWRNERRI